MSIAKNFMKNNSHKQCDNYIYDGYLIRFVFITQI
jgi:hypothetical protein